MYDLYKEARNLSWQALIDCKIDRLPIDLGQVAKHYGIRIVLYSDFSLVQLFSTYAKDGDGFIAQVDGQKIIYLNDRVKTYGRRRFTLAHELGHALCGHPLDEIQARNSEQDCPDDPVETQANIFARDLLMPAGVLHAVGATAPEEIMRLCEVSRQSAEIRAARLELLRQRGAFGLHPLERIVMERFQEYIENRLL